MKLIIVVSYFPVLWLLCQSPLVNSTTGIQHNFDGQSSSSRSKPYYCFWRGGSSAVFKAKNVKSKVLSDEDRAYHLLASAIRFRLREKDETDSTPDISRIVDAFKHLSSSQQTFKGLDGAAHEAYQRTHSRSTADDDSLISVSGRAQRSAARAGAVADGLFACELCELLEYPSLVIDNSSQTINGTLANREVVVNLTNAITIPRSNINVSVLVLYETTYQGGAGIHHGGVEDLTANDNKRNKTNGRLLIIFYDDAVYRLDATLRILGQDRPQSIQRKLFHDRHGTDEMYASVQPALYQSAGSLLNLIEPQIRMYNHTCAIHFTGRSLAGGIASLAAVMLHGEIPLPRNERKQDIFKKSRKLKTVGNIDKNGTGIAELTSLQGFGKGRTSATILGSPPCLSKNIPTPFITSIMYGDDVICRASYDSIERLIARTLRALRSSSGVAGALIGKQLNWMTDTVSLAASSLTLGSSSSVEKTKLSISGKAYLLRPRRLGGGSCSIHEIGSGHQGTFRAAILWQLNDILLSKSLWKHHQLHSYIHGLDRVHLRGTDE